MTGLVEGIHYWYKVYRSEQTVAAGSFVTINLAPRLQANVELYFTDGRRLVFHQPVSVDFL